MEEIKDPTNEIDYQRAWHAAVATTIELSRKQVQLREENRLLQEEVFTLQKRVRALHAQARITKTSGLKRFWLNLRRKTSANQ